MWLHDPTCGASVRAFVDLGPGGWSSQGSCRSSSTDDEGCSGASFVPGVASRFDFDLNVPAKDRRVQYLRLDLAARSASEQLVSGTVWYDDLQLSRAGKLQPG